MNNLGKVFRETRIADITGDDPINLNFLGDPELPVWTDELTDLAINVNPGSLTIGENTLEVTITGLSNEEQALVCIYKENEVYGVKKDRDLTVCIKQHLIVNPIQKTHRRRSSVLLQPARTTCMQRKLSRR